MRCGFRHLHPWAEFRMTGRKGTKIQYLYKKKTRPIQPRRNARYGMHEPHNQRRTPSILDFNTRLP